MNKIIFSLLAIAVCLNLSFVVFATKDVDKIISVAELVENKEIYDQKIVRVEGYASMGFENCILRPVSAEKSSYSFKHRVWFREFEKGCGTGEYAKVSKYGQAIIEGTFSKNDRGHLGSYSGSINNAKIIWLKNDNDKGDDKKQPLIKN